MKTKVFVFVLLSLIFVSCKNQVDLETNEVVLSGSNFTPNSISVEAGSTITWVNNEAITSSVTSDSILFDSGNMAKGNTFKYTFNNPGIYTYHNKNNSGMKGTITVASNSFVKEIIISGFSFSPSILNIAPGTTVKWINKDPVTHLVKSDNVVFESGNLNQGDSYSFTFKNVGTFSYHCRIHPSMTGTVVVQ